MIELLAPAGNKDSFYAAINGGANAVYLGLDLFSARKNAENFTKENLPYYITYAHLLGVKVYVALNTLVGDKELDDFFDYAGFCNDSGVDALIVQDIFLGKLLHRRFPDLELHLSTQAGVNNVYGATLAKEFGFCRVVLARETPLTEIEKITKIVETEVFVQGALCTAFSGQCYMSSFAGNNSGNRGLCKQPCRKLYSLKNNKINKNGYLISLADLSINDKLTELLQAGVTSLKIEGRMRKPSYVYYASNYYYELLNGKKPSISPLSRSFKRGNYTHGLAFKQDGNFISDKVQSHVGETIGKITSVNKQFFSAKSNHAFSIGDCGKVLRGGEEVGNYTCDTDYNLRYQGSCKIGNDLTLTCDVKLEKDYLNYKKSLPISLLIRFFADKKAEVTFACNDFSTTFYSDFVLQKAQNRPITEDEIKDNFLKCGDYPLSPIITVETDGVFIAKSQLNAFRRQVYDQIVKILAPQIKRRNIAAPFNLNENAILDKDILIIDEDFSDISDYDFTVAVFAPQNYCDEKSFDKFFSDLKNNDCLKYLYLPPLLNSADNGLIAPLLNKFDGVYVDGYYGIDFAKEYNIPCILGTGANLYNVVSVKEARNVCKDVALSKELSLSAARGLNGYYLAGGALKVMDLCYCPFGKTCKNCTGEDYSVLSDGERDFVLRRIKLSECRFEVYNPYPLLTEGSTKQAFNFVTLKKARKIAILNNLNCPINAKNHFDNYTTGHSKKPLN